MSFRLKPWAALMCAAVPFLSFAQSTLLDPVQVTGSRSPQRVSQTLGDVSVLTRTDIEAAGGRTLAELLAREAGVQVWSNGGLGKAASVSMRGMESRHTLLLVDGVPMGSATLGTPSWDNLPLDAIERIEIVRGPMSGLYGSAAVGGVVQVFTRQGGQGLKLSGAAMVGSFADRELSAGLRGGNEVLEGSVRIQAREQGGFSAANANAPFGNFNPDRDGFDQRSFSGRLALKLASWRAEAMLLKSNGTSHYDDGPGADARSDLGNQVSSLQLGGALSPSWRTQLRVSRSEDDADTRATASSFTPLGLTRTVEDRLAWENSIDTPVGTVLGLVERTEQTVRRPGTAYSVSERRLQAAALGLTGQAGPHSWQLNARRDSNSQFGSQNGGAAAYGLQLTPQVRVGASWGTAFVLPSFNQLYFPAFGNPKLLPEESRQRELNVRWSGETVTARLAWFNYRVRNFISSGPLPTNIPQSSSEGLSASLETQQGPWLLTAALDLNDPTNQTNAASTFGKQLPRRVRESARLAADWREGAWSAGASVVAFGPSFENAANTQRLSGFAVIDARLDWKLSRQLNLGLRLGNVLDQRYETALGYNQAGRHAQLTLRFES
ncbi:MAG: TonB-dependent receptor domain-containing protein [Burkholderiales bacterium]